MLTFSLSRSSQLLSRLIKKAGGDAHDKRTWYIGGKEVNQGQDAERYKGFGRRKGKDATEGGGEEEVASSTTPAGSASANSVADDLLGLDLSSGTTTDGAPSPSPVAPAADVSSPPSSASKSLPPSSTPTPRKQTLSHGADKWLTRLVYNSEGILWEDAQLQVGVKCEFHGHQGRIALYFGNKISVALESFTVSITNDDPDALVVTLPKIATPNISALSQVQQLVHVDCRNVFTSPPILNISYLAGSLQTLTLRLPIWLVKFLEPVKLDASSFFERWKQIGGPPREAQKIFPIVMDPATGKVDVAKHRRVVGGTKMGVLEGIDPNAQNIVAAGVLHMGEGGKVGCLLRLEPNAEAKVCSLLFFPPLFLSN